jgi:hypothetical protein
MPQSGPNEHGTAGPGRKLVVLGNGPSLREIDLASIKGVESLGMNAAYRYWERVGWYPDIYACLDDQMVGSHKDAIIRLYRDRRCKVFFLHQDILGFFPELAKKPNVYFLASFVDRAWATRFRYRVKLHPSEFFPPTSRKKLTTGSHAVRLGAFLGYREFLLLGIDCRYEPLPEAEAIGGTRLRIRETPLHNPNYFFDDYQSAGDVYNVPSPGFHRGNLHLQSFESLRDDLQAIATKTIVSVGTTHSELFTKGVFPYLAPSEFDASIRRATPQA